MYAKVMAQNVPKCNGSYMSHSYWNDGSSATKLSRMIHVFNDIVYLVSASFVCDKRHKILAHDESILQQLPTSLFYHIKLGLLRNYLICVQRCAQGDQLL